MSSARWCSVLLQELVHVPDIFESMQKLTHALRPSQGMEHVRGNQVQVLELNSLHGVLRHVIPKGQIHVFAKVW
jgi:hypothetical protein